MVAKLTPAETRALDTIFVAQCSLEGLAERLPLRWPTPPGIPPSPKRAYRSEYVYPGWEDLKDPSVWKDLDEFDLLLRLVDFGGLRPVLAHLLGWESARGLTPFDPVSIFLLTGWQITRGWNRAETLRNLHKARYADYARLFGFRDGVFPTEGGLRYFLTTLGKNSEVDGEMVTVDEEEGIAIPIQKLNMLIAQSIALVHDTGIISQEAWRDAIICPDGMLHHAASRMRCSSVTDTCYQPAPRPCPAKEKDRQGCDCDTADCAQICRYATPRDPDARYVWYSGSNRPGHNPNRFADQAHSDKNKKRGKGYYGYRSLPLQLTDPQRRFSLVIADDFLPANSYEADPAAALLLQLKSFYPDLDPRFVVGDSNFGHDRFLRVVYRNLRARRVIDLRSHETDRNKSLWPIRGYNDKGHPVCHFGYPFSPNGYDAGRRRLKWVCAQACSNGKDPLVSLPNVSYPPEECPYRSPQHPLGRIINLAEAFPDGSTRLARDVPPFSASWKRIYHRARNAVEGRNSSIKRWDLKRLPFHGLHRNKSLVFLADVLLNLTTLARLVREATAATGVT